MNIASFIKTGRLFVLPLICMSVFMTACTEEEKTEPDYSKVYLIKKRTIENVSSETQQSFSYEYSETGSVMKVTWDNPSGSDVYDYVYGQGLITIMHSSDYSSADTTVIELNGAGLAVSLDNRQQKRITRYKYDDQGYCINSNYSAYGADTSDITQEIERANFTYIEGNLILEKRVYNGNEIGSIQHYYYKDKINITGNANTGMGFFGKSSKNLVKTAAVDEFDTEGRLIKRTEGETIYSYEYY